MQDPVQEIKGKLDIVDVVTPYVQLKPAGKYMKACCPFHQEKTPSFFVSPERQIAYCFSCQKGGDMFQFIQEIEGVDFRGALETLADKANVELPKHSGGPKISKDLKDRLKAVNQDTSKFFVQQLWDTENGKKVLAYLRSRGIEDETIKTFKIGFAPESQDMLYRYLLEKKHEKVDTLESSVVVARDSESKKVSDRFWLRLMFPIDNIQGDIIAFNGRALKKESNPKYLNSPEYVLYHKGATIYNLSRAKQSIREKDLTIFVEGQFDTIASHQVGVENVVATSGTALTAEQFKVVKRYSKKVALAFDADNAGQEALLRAVHTSQPLGLELYVIDIAGGKDTADLVKEDSQLWISAVESKKPYLEFFEEKLQAKYDLETADGKRHFTDEMLDILQGVKHPVEQDHYLKKLSSLVSTPVEMLYDYLGQLKDKRRHRAVKKEAAPELVKREKQDRLVEYFFGMILAFPKHFFKLWEILEKFEEFDERARALGLNRQMGKLNEEGFSRFRNDFFDSLSKDALGFDASSVYKQVRDHYNLHAEVDEVFYDGIEGGENLRKIAFEAEIKNPDSGQIRNEFEKLITLLYFEFTS